MATTIPKTTVLLATLQPQKLEGRPPGSTVELQNLGPNPIWVAFGEDPAQCAPGTARKITQDAYWSFRIPGYVDVWICTEQADQAVETGATIITWGA